jgi:hypothetical protein
MLVTAEQTAEVGCPVRPNSFSIDYKSRRYRSSDARDP